MSLIYKVANKEEKSTNPKLRAWLHKNKCEHPLIFIIPREYHYYNEMLLAAHFQFQHRRFKCTILVADTWPTFNLFGVIYSAEFNAKP